MSEKKPRVRFAPSPTGYLHVGGLRTALYNYLYARKNQGVFILRIEDTDQKRFVENAVEGLIRSLRWADLTWEEGVYEKNNLPEIGIKNQSHSKNYSGIVEVGGYGPYIQSERLEIYKKYAEQLVREGKAYYCFCEPGRLEEMRARQAAEKQAPMYDRYCLMNVSEEAINENLKKNCSHTIRLKVPRDRPPVEFEDAVRGKVSFNVSTIDDQILLKSDGFPTYHLANVVDDHLMAIDLVIRGEEWLPSTPKHILLYEAFGWEVPKFAHLPLLLNPDKTKLSKRQGDVAVEDYLRKGYLKEALVNFIALLGWNPGAGSTQEIFSLEELVENFDLKKAHKAGAVFDLKKLDWINSQYIKKLPLEDLYKKSREFLAQEDFFMRASSERKSEHYVKKVLAIEQERLNNLAEVGESNKFFFRDIECDRELLRWKAMTDEDLKRSLEKSRNVLEGITEADWTKGNLEGELMAAAGDNRGGLLWPLRASLTGESKSPSPFEVAWVLGKNESLKRINQALEKI